MAINTYAVPEAPSALRVLLDANPLPSLAVDESCLVLDANAEGWDLLGQRQQAGAAVEYCRLFWADDAPHRCVASRAFERQGLTRGLSPHPSIDGVVLEHHARPILLPDGARVVVVALASTGIGELRRELERRDRELVALNALAQACTGRPDEPRLLESVVRQLSKLVDLSACAVWIEGQPGVVSGSLSYFVLRPGGVWEPGRPPRHAEVLIRSAVRRRQPILSSSSAAAAPVGRRAQRLEPGARSPEAFAVLPLFGSDALLGALAAFTRQPRGFSEGDIRLLTIAGNQVTACLTVLRHFDVAKGEAEALAEANERLRELNRLKSEFVSLVSHELRTPLAGISAHAWTLTEYWERLSEQERRRSILSIGHRTHRLERLITDLLTLSRIEAGRPIEVAPECVELDPLIRQVVTELVDEYGSRTLEVDLPPDMPAAFADGSRVEQVLTNLIDNALKFSPADAPVHVRVVVDASEMIVQVVDRGRGIPSSDVNRLFQRFVRLPSRGGEARPGTGIGLYLAKQLVEAQGGRIGVNSEEVAGSTFWFSLPRADVRGGSPSRTS